MRLVDLEFADMNLDYRSCAQPGERAYAAVSHNCSIFTLHTYTTHTHAVADADADAAADKAEAADAAADAAADSAAESDAVADADVDADADAEIIFTHFLHGPAVDCNYKLEQ